MYFWEAVGGRGRPWGSDWLRKIWDSLTQLPRSIWANQSPTASQGLPNLSCDLSEPIREHGLPRKCDLRGRSDSTGQCSPILGAVWLISRLNALLRPESVGGRSDSQICEADRTLKSVRPIGLSDHMTLCWEAVLGLPRPHRFESPIGLIDLRVRSASQIWESDRPLMHRPREYDPRARLTDFTAKCIASAGRGATGPVCVRGRSDSQICEADRTLTASHFDYWLLIL